MNISHKPKTLHLKVIYSWYKVNRSEWKIGRTNAQQIRNNR